MTKEGCKASEAARKLGISAGTLTRWKHELGQSPEERRAAADTKQELRRLRKEHKQLLLEVEILKKANAFFGGLPDNDDAGSSSGK